MRRLLAATLLLWANAAQAEGLDQAWVGTQWGETAIALQQHFGTRAFPVPRPIDYGDSYAPLVLRDVRVGGLSMIAYYQIDKTTHGLKRIQLERPRHQVNAGTFRAVFMALVGDYGGPDVSCGVLPGPTTAYQGAAQYVWKRDDAMIRAIFRDTTLQALEGCYSPACGLTAQLLLRISPPSEDTGTCPAPPTDAQMRVR